MQEHMREKSLQWLGIKPMQPRYQLPGAKISPVLLPDDLPKRQSVISSNSVESLQAVVSSPASPIHPSQPAENLPRQSGMKHALSALWDSPLKEAIKPNDRHLTEKAEVTPLAVDQVQALKFRLRVVRLQSLLFVLPQPTLVWHDENLQLLFMQDIYRALFKCAPQEQVNEVFNWPPSSSLMYDNAHDLARETVTHFIEGLLDQQDAPWVIAFGLSDYDYLLPTEEKKGVFYLSETTPMISANSIASYFTDPLSKRTLWHQLQAISC